MLASTRLIACIDRFISLLLALRILFPDGLGPTNCSSSLGFRVEIDRFSHHCSVTRTWITLLPSRRGSRALPTTAPSIRLRSVPFIAWPGVDEVTSRSPPVGELL